MSDTAATADDVGTHIEGVLSRSVVLMGSKASTWVLAFVMTIMLPRYLNAAGYGQLYFAISFTTMASILVEFGLNALVAREVARRPEESVRYLANGALLKTLLWLVACAIILAVVNFAHYPVTTRWAVAILTFGMLVTSLDTLVTAVLQGTDKARWVAASAIFEKAAYVVLGAGALLLGFHVIAVALAIVAAAVAKLLLDLSWLHRLSRSVSISETWRGLDVAALFRRAVPFFSMLFFGAIYFRVDVIIMSLFKSDAVVGYYGAAYRLFETTNLVPEAMMFAFFPMFCRLAKRDDGSLGVAARKGVDLLLLLGVPIATGICVLAEKIIHFLYGAQYSSSIVVLRILAVGVALMYVNGAFTQLLIATERQRRLVITAAVAAVFNVTSNLVLIPLLGAMGGAITTVATEAVVIGLNFSFLPKTLTSQMRSAGPLKVALSATIMALVLLSLGDEPLLLLVIVGAAVYIAGLVVFRALPAEDWAMVRRSLMNMRAA